MLAPVILFANYMEAQLTYEVFGLWILVQNGVFPSVVDTYIICNFAFSTTSMIITRLNSGE